LNTQLATSYRDSIIPNLTQGYQAIVRRHQVQQDVSFGDVVVAQQNLAEALQNYIEALRSQWKAVVDVARIAQLDDLYSDSFAVAR
jgi:hypothetical protein